MPCFDRCHLIVTWMSNIKEVISKPRLHVSLSTCYLEYGSHLARLHSRHRRRRRRAYVPTRITASHDNHEKIKSWVSFVFHIWVAYGAPLDGRSGRRSSAMNTNNLSSLKVNLLFQKFHKLFWLQNFVEAKENSVTEAKRILTAVRKL